MIKKVDAHDLKVFWGTAILLFLIKWINLHNSVQQGFWLEVSQQVETGIPIIAAFMAQADSSFIALFTVTGVVS